MVSLFQKQRHFPIFLLKCVGRSGAFWGIKKREDIYFKKSAKIGSQKMATWCHFFKKNVIFQFFFLNVWGVPGRFVAFWGVSERFGARRYLF
jgi:hypothetical protein